MLMLKLRLMLMLMQVHRVNKRLLLILHPLLSPSLANSRLWSVLAMLRCHYHDVKEGDQYVEEGDHCVEEGDHCV